MIFGSRNSHVFARYMAVLLDRLAFACLWIFVMAVPWEGKVAIAGFPATRWLGFLAFGAALVRLLAVRRVRRATPVHWLMAAFVCWVALSLTWSGDPAMTMSRLGSYAQLLLMVWLVWEIAETDSRIASLLYAYCLGTCVSSVQTLHNFATGFHSGSEEAVRLAGYGRFAPEGFDQNELALTLALGIPMSLYLLSRIRSKIPAAVCWAQIGLSTTAILLTGSRAGLLALGAAACILPFSVLNLPGWRRPLSLLLIAVVLASAVVLVPVATWDRLLGTWTEVRAGTLDERTVIWRAGLEVFRQHPFIGAGAGAFAASVVSKIDRPYVAHNSFLSVLTELGVVGAMVFFLMLVGLGYLAFRMPVRERWLWTVELMTWAVGVSSLTWEYRKVTWLIFGLIVAQAAALIRKRNYFPSAERPSAVSRRNFAGGASPGASPYRHRPDPTGVPG